MIEQIALLNPIIGQYEYFETNELAKQRFSELMMEFFLLHTHQQPFSMIGNNEDGTQTWKSIDINTIIN